MILKIKIGDKMKKLIAIGIIILFIGLTITPCTSGYTTKAISNEENKHGIKDTESIYNENLGGTLSGYVTDFFLNPIEGAKVCVYFHDTYAEAYTDSNGNYHVTGIPICRCIKKAVASKEDYISKSIDVNIKTTTINNFVLIKKCDSTPYPITLFIHYNLVTLLESLTSKTDHLSIHLG